MRLLMLVVITVLVVVMSKLAYMYYKTARETDFMS